MSATTLLEQAKLITNPQAQAITNMFALEYTAGALLPYKSSTGYDYPFTIFDTLPTVAPRDFNADFTSDFGKSSSYRIPWKNYGGKLEVDRALKLGNPSGAALQETLQVSAIAKKWNIDMFEGAGGTSLLGIQTFINSFWTGQNLNAGTTAGGDVLTMAMLDDLMSLVDNPSALFVTEIVRKRITVLARSQTVHNIFFTPDAFGTPIMHYGATPIYTMRDGDTGNDILSITEIDGAASASTTSSVYAVRFGEDGLHGFAPGGQGMSVTMSNPGTNYDVTRIEKNAGVCVEHKRAVARLRYVKQSVS